MRTKLTFRALACLLAATALPSANALGQAAPDSIEQARILLATGKVQESEGLLRSYLQNHSESADAHFLLGYALFREQKAAESLAEFTAGAKYRRPHPDELRVVAGDYVLLKDYQSADKWFSQVVAETPGDAEAWYLLGRTKYNESEFSAAIADFEQSLNLRPRNVETENNIGLGWKELNENQKAQAAFETAIAWQGNNPSDAQPFLNLGSLFIDDHRYTDAVSFLEKAAALSPGNPSIHEKLAKAYLGLDKLSDAQAQLEKAIEESPETAPLHFQLGQVLRREGLSDRALREFEICEKLNGARSSSKTPNPP